MLQATVLGISSSIPLKDRNHSSLAIKYDGEVILFDAGEAVQQRLMKTKISNMEIDKIFITHFHADHFLGLPGLLATMSLHKRDSPINIYGPKGIEQRVKTILQLFEIQTVYEIKYHELHDGIVCDTKEYTISAKRVKHLLETYAFVFKEKDIVGKFVKEKALALGIPEGPLYSELKEGKEVKYKGKLFIPKDVMDYTYVRKGKSIGYVVDCFDSGYENFLQDVDILFHETMFMRADSSLANKTKHSITVNAAQIAKLAHAKRLIIFNFSARYTDLDLVLHEVQTVYPNAELAEELKTYKLKD